MADCEQLVADLQRQLAECRAEPDEALQYQTATSEVLKVIAGDPEGVRRALEAGPKPRLDQLLYGAK